MQVQEYIFEWYDLKNMRFDNLTDAILAVIMRNQRREKRNKRSRKRDFSYNGFGIESDYPVRIIDQDGKVHYTSQMK